MKYVRENIWQIGILFAFIAIAGSLAVSRPETLADNKFLDELMGPDLVAVLVIVLTITFASVANVHLSISRVVARAPAGEREAAEAVAQAARSEMNSNAWTLFWAFLAALIALFIDGEFPDDKMIDAVMTAVCLTVIVLNGLVMHDIYSSIFLLVAQEKPEAESNKPKDYPSDGTVG